MAVAGAPMLLLVACGAAPAVRSRRADARAIAARRPRAYIRLDQVGYEPAARKRALVMTRAPLRGRFAVRGAGGRRVLAGRLGRDLGRWSPRFPHVYAADLTRLRAPGRYELELGGTAAARPAVLRIAPAPALYPPLVSDALRFFAAQRDGPQVDPAVLRRRPSHLTDRTAAVYATPAYRRDRLSGSLRRIGGPVDVSGGWFDAGDYLKFVETGSYSTAALLFALRQYPRGFGARRGRFLDEARFELDWLERMWDARTRTLYLQVGLGDGDGRRVLGSHDVWQLPQASDRLPATSGALRFVKYRPVFEAAAPGARLSPNLAGRLGAAFGLCSQVFRRIDPAYANGCLARGQAVFAMARTHGVRRLRTAVPYDYYPEAEWRDDLEWGAIELYLGTAGAGHVGGRRTTSPATYLRRAALWADRYMRSPEADEDPLGLYDVSALAHFELYRAIRNGPVAEENLDVSRRELLGDLRDRLRLAAARSRRDPFGLGGSYADGDTAPRALGTALEARLYDELARSRMFEALAETQLAWAFGDNAWGASFMGGAGAAYPRCVHHQTANLALSRPAVLLGAVVGGPNSSASVRSLQLPDGARRCPVPGGDRYRAFDGRGARYLDDVRASASVEPADDYAATAVAALAQTAG